MTHPSPREPHPSVSVLVTRCPMRGRLVAAADPRAGLLYVRDDATVREIGRAILAAAHAIAEFHRRPDRRHRGEELAPVIPLARRCGPDYGEGDQRGLG